MPTCHDIFNTARAERAKYPLTKGQYKLDEAAQTLNAWHELITTIAERVRIGGSFGETESLGPCMATERGTYLKSIPARLSELLGYTILPAIAALEGDGVPTAEVQRLLNHAENDAQRLIDDCEVLRLRLECGINHEHYVMKDGDSHLVSLLAEAKEIARICLMCR